MDRYTVVSSDCHAGPLPEKYREYLEPKYRPIFDQALPIHLAQVAKVEKSFLIQEVNEEWRKPIQQQLIGTWDDAERTKVLDSEGIAAEIIYVDGITERNSPPFGAGLSLPTEGIDPELQWAGARAHNRFLAELCAYDPVRRHGVAVMPLLWDIDQAIEHLNWLVENGIRNVRATTRSGRRARTRVSSSTCTPAPVRWAISSAGNGRKKMGCRARSARSTWKYSSGPCAR
jgi:hypothetical protein